MNFKQVENIMEQKMNATNAYRADRSGDALNFGPSENYDSVTFKMFQTQKNKENLYDDLRS